MGLGGTWGQLGTLGNTWGGFRGQLETIGLGHVVGLGNLPHGIQTFRLTLGDTWAGTCCVGDQKGTCLYLGK